MPKLLFSKIRIYEFKDLIRNNKQPKLLDVLMSKNKQKNNIRCVLIQKWTDADYQLQEHLMLGLKLSDLLKNQDYLAAFRSFLETEYSAENVDFWLACREYKEISPGKCLYRAAEIYEEFLHPMAQKEVNVDHHIREKIKRSLAKPDLTCFDEAASHIYRLMEEDSCPRFHKSEVYQNLRNTDRNPK
ncbi:regulator of G-protein signaling 21 [Triplophysa rosa]|uniref:Regulator of G-protein signaling 21-like n=1 Tax=Triplophysa rosa TaxID=992332 RepID=A0A9W7T7A4_TRIRA|nr:regulator of G-protein signaling 21 [Triplophysa rosa]KAI7791376.1 putative regulator of G-protein signaling 21-like [Triplophysa rosa]